MSRTPREPGVVKELHIFSQKVNRNGLHIDMLLKTLKDSYDIILVQELPWKVIHKTVSMTNPHGDNVKHPNWLYMVQPMAGGETPHIMACYDN
jgi:hypothetical protein